MNEELFQDLVSLKEDLGIPNEDFMQMIKYALVYIKSNNLPMESLYEIVSGTMEFYDYGDFSHQKDLSMAFKMALSKLDLEQNGKTM